MPRNSSLLVQGDVNVHCIRFCLYHQPCLLQVINHVDVRLQGSRVDRHKVKMLMRR